MKRYTEEHQWIQVEGDTAIIGISAFAADELGELSYVELPEVGKTVKGGEPLCVVESVKAASDVFMPVTATIAEVNQDLDANPELINDSPEDEGWICKVTAFNAQDVEKLMDQDAYQAFLKA